MNEILPLAWNYFWRQEMPYIILFALLLFIGLWHFLIPERRSVLNAFGFFILCLAGQLFASFIHALGFPRGAITLHELFLVGSGIAVIRLLGLFIFRLLLSSVKVRVPRILEEIVVVLGFVSWGLVRLHIGGLDLSGIVATSAVITGVLAFSMQETLGNLLGGLALQFDDSIVIGDWIKLDELSGRVSEIRWRYMAIETRNGETLVVPNSMLMKGKFTIIGRRGDDPYLWRRWVWFNVDYNVAPARVIQAAEQAMANAEIPNVAQSPEPSCVLMDFGANYGKYALRYWIINPRDDDPTDSVVRMHLYAALQRADIRFARPEHAVHMIAEDVAHREEVRMRELARRLASLKKVELFSSLSQEELRTLAQSLVYSPFAKGDLITRQGMIAHWLYVLVAGEVEVWFESSNKPRHLLATLPAGSVFGEMGLLTGEPRRATVTAQNDVECYRLDKTSFESIIRLRPGIAEELSVILAERMSQLEQAQQDLSHEDAFKLSGQQHSILGKIRVFFGLAG